MNAGIFLLGLAYVLSQFFRAFLAVLSSVLEADIGVTPDELADASGMWFLAFAVMQIPVGWALDTIGPRRTGGWLLLIGGGGGAAAFALATSALHINIAMALIGVGCSPVLMASYYIFARDYPPKQFAVLASLIVGLGSVGNLAASYPMTFAAEIFGWRTALWGLGGISALVAIGILIFVRDPKPVEDGDTGTLLELLRLRVLWPIYPIIFFSYAISGAIRGLWIGPYLADTFAANTDVISAAGLLMGIAMIVGTLAYGPVDRFLPSRKWMIVGGTFATFLCGATLVALPTQGLWLSVALMCGIGFFGATYPVLMAHGRSFLPSHLIGRGVTMLNLCSIGGVGALQFLSGRVYRATAATNFEDAAYVNVFAMFTGCVLIGLVIYLFSRDAPQNG